MLANNALLIFHFLSILSYIYTGSLPSLMTIDTAKELTAMAGNSPKKLSRLIDLCKGFIENLALKKGMLDLTQKCFS